jgi:hypothetical protein
LQIECCTDFFKPRNMVASSIRIWFGDVGVFCFSKSKGQSSTFPFPGLVLWSLFAASD